MSEIALGSQSARAPKNATYDIYQEIGPPMESIQAASLQAAVKKLEDIRGDLSGSGTIFVVNRDHLKTFKLATETRLVAA